MHPRSRSSLTCQAHAAGGERVFCESRSCNAAGRPHAPRPQELSVPEAGNWRDLDMPMPTPPLAAHGPCHWQARAPPAPHPWAQSDGTRSRRLAPGSGMGPLAHRCETRAHAQHVHLHIVIHGAPSQPLPPGLVEEKSSTSIHFILNLHWRSLRRRCLVRLRLWLPP